MLVFETMRVFQFERYREYLQNRLELMPHRGHGQLRKMAEYLSIHPTRMSHIYRGEVELTFEQAARLCSFLGLGELESEYFLALVELERAGNEELKTIVYGRLKKLKEQSKELSKVLPQDKFLTESDQAIFYSSWKYSAVRLASDISELKSVEAISERLDISISDTQKIVDFLLKVGLCIEKDGILEMGPRRTHLSSDSPLVTKLHTNWRLKAIHRYEKMGKAELSYTAPMSLGLKEQDMIRNILIQAIEKSTKLAAESQSEGLMHLNIDWLKI